MKYKFGVKVKLLSSFVGFSLIVFILLWILQVVLLDDVYRTIKINSVRNAAEKMDGMSDEELQYFVLEKSSSVGLCSSVYSADFTLIAQEHAGGQCVVHNITDNTVRLFYEATAEFSEKRFESHLPANDIMAILKQREFPIIFQKPNNGFYIQTEPALSASTDAYDCILYSEIIENDLGEERYVLLSSVIIPVESTVVAIRFELGIITAFLLIVAVILAFVLSKTVSYPITALNKAAKLLPDGKFDGEGIQGYREVEELSETLSRSAEEIRRVDSLRKELLANVSHDLRTPLTLITGYSEVMRDIPGENTPENLQVVIDEANRLSVLVTDLLDLSKLEEGSDSLNTEKIELNSFIRQILNRYEKLTAVQGYEICYQGVENEVFVLADSVKLNQVIYNLVNNAIHYGGNDKKIQVRLSVKGDKALFEVEDHGEGIPQEKLLKIWDRYYRLEEHHRSAKIGSGLGLSIVKRVLDLHESEYGVQSKVGQGSVFWFTLKLLKD